jgi:hypothetical protein
MPLPRTECPVCERDIAITRRGLTYRHDPPERDRELKSCPGSLKPVQAPAGDPVLFISPDDLTPRSDLLEGSLLF